MSSAYAFPVDDLIIAQGRTFARSYPVEGVLMAGATVAGQIRATAASPDVLYQLTVTLDADDPGVPVGQSGTVTVSVPAADSWDWSWTEAVWDAVLTTGDGLVVARVSGGKVRVVPGVTRP